MTLDDVIKEYQKNGGSLIVVPKYGTFLEYQKPGCGGFKITKYDSTVGIVELTRVNSKGKKTIAYININNIAILIDETDLWS